MKKISDYATPTQWKWLAFITYNLIVALLLFNHDMWRDEWQAITMATDIHSFSEYIGRMRLEGHPPLWYALIKIVWSIYPSGNSVKIIHFCITLFISFYLLFRISFVSMGRKALFLFGYYMIFEYASISRNYSLVVLFMLVALNNIEMKTFRHRLWVLIAVCGMMLTHIYGIIMAFGVLFYISYDYLLKPKELFTKHRILLFLLASCLAILLTILLIPHKHMVVYPTGHSKFLNLFLFAPKAFAFMWDAIVNIPLWQNGFWNKNILGMYMGWEPARGTPEFNIKLMWYCIRAVLMLPVIYLIYLDLKSNRKLLFTLIVIWALIYTVQVEVYWGYLRHSGFYYVSLMMVMFLSMNKPMKFIPRIASIQFIATALALFMSCRATFSHGNNVVKWAEKNFPNAVINFNDPMSATTLAGYAGHKIFVNGKVQETRYVKFDSLAWPGPVKLEKMVLQTDSICSRLQNKNAVLVLDRGYTKEEMLWLENQNWKYKTISFSRSVSGENFTVLGWTKP